MIVSMLIMEYCASQINPIAIATVNSSRFALLHLISHILNLYSSKNNKKIVILLLLNYEYNV